ncbi:MAG: hypothetical protein DLM55_10735 [Acidimicrobiales bacterium]|nr:MAG: hypothetical protein DLM55_10735 [Acidimicrobiales bacterium]
MTVSPNEHELLSISDTIRRLSLGRTKVYELIRNRKLRSFKVGSRRLIPAIAIGEFVTMLENEDLSYE